jgi:hypothetical protein
MQPGVRLPVGGISLNPYNLGYYGGFIDPPCIEDDMLDNWLLCNACARRLFDMFPALLARYDEWFDHLVESGAVLEVGGPDDDF